MKVRTLLDCFRSFNIAGKNNKGNNLKDFPAPAITQVLPYPKQQSLSSGAIIRFTSTKAYKTYELLIRVPGNPAMDIIPVNISGNPYTCNLSSKPLTTSPVDFILSNPDHLQVLEVQLRGIQPASFPLRTHYSEWSDTFRFSCASPLSGIKSFFVGLLTARSIKQYLPSATNGSLQENIPIEQLRAQLV